MGLKITIDDALMLDSAVWRSILKPGEVKTFGDCSSRKGPYSVILVEKGLNYDEYSQSLSFDLSTVKLLNIGSTDQLIILTASSARSIPAASRKKPPKKPVVKPIAKKRKKSFFRSRPEKKSHAYELSQTLAQGDRLFLGELPGDIREVGEKLLSKIRSQFKGELNYEPRNGKFEETPDNFWSIKILPWEKSLAISVRGVPEFFSRVPGIHLSPDKYGCSVFEVKRVAQIDGAMAIIRQASSG